MRKILLLLAIFMGFSVLLLAQTESIKGTVVDQNAAPVPFATITIKGTSTAVSADADGKFLIRAAKGGTLVVSATGYSTEEVMIDGPSVAVVLNKGDGQLIEEVVVTALGIQRQAKSVGYATAKVSSDELTKASAVNAVNGLQGKVSGLNITSVNNGVFENVKINLRGIRSLVGSNNPMLLLDGVPVEISLLARLNPNDIQDVNVLKGSSAAAIYGSDARNGVIIVTTKKGTTRPTVNFNTSAQFQKISFFPEFQTEFGSGGYGSYIPYENWSWGPAFDGSMVEIGKPLEDGSVQTVPYSPNNSRKEFFNTGVTLQNDLSFSAKDFFLSISDANITGIIPDDLNRRTGIRLNTGREFGRFRAQVNMNYVQSNFNVFDDEAMGDYNAANNVGLNNGIMNLIFNTPAQIPITSYKDFTNNKFATYNNYFTDYGLNPYFALDNWRSVGNGQSFVGNLELGAKATDWLNFTYRAGVTSNTQNVRRTSKGETPDAFGLSRSFTSIASAVTEGSGGSTKLPQSGTFVRLSSEIFATVNKDFNDFKLNAIVGNYIRQVENKETSVGASNLVVPELFNISQRTGELNGYSNYNKTRLVALYGSVGLSYKGWANIEGTARNEWVSVLAPGQNSYFYPGVSASFVATDAIEGLKSDAVSYVKLRAAWNKTGSSDIAAYNLISTFSQPTGFPFGALPGYSADDRAFSYNLKPEFVSSKEVGIELGFLRNRINVEATYFNQDNTDQIIPIRVSSSTGYTSLLTNAASFTNKGVELDLRITPLVKFNGGGVEFRANATYNDNKISRIAENLNEVFVGGFNNFAANYAVNGLPAMVFKLTDYLRDDQGRVIVGAADGYPILDPNNKIFGRTLPLWILGFNPSVNWKGLNFSVLAEYRAGHYAYHDIGQAMAWTGVSAYTARNHRERFVFPNSVYEDPNNPGTYLPNTNISVANVNDFYTGVYRDVATNFFTSAASWRLREASLSYNLPINQWFKSNFIKGANLSLVGRNLFLWLPSTNVYSDPDFNFSFSGNTSGVGVSAIAPPVRTFGASLSITF